MKQIVEEASLTYVMDNIPSIKAIHLSVRAAFEAGAEWQSKQSPWISVKERLPEENSNVFFTVEWKDFHKGYFVGLYYGDGQWESDHRIFLLDSSLGCITHWMPIPKFD